MLRRLENFVKKHFSTLKKCLFKNLDWKKTLLASSFLLFTFVIIFPAGALSSKTTDEICANYYAEVSKNFTTNTGKKHLSGLVVEPKDSKTSKMRQDTENAITELWGVFKGDDASFAPVINANRDNNIRFSDPAFSNESLSLVYSNVGGSSEPYHIDKDTKNIIDYKFQSSPLALMFSSSASGMRKELHIFISQSQAERKLLSMEKEINEQNLKQLQYTSTDIIINGNSYSCIIDNIYLDNFDHKYHFSDYDYYYATDVGTIIGDFVFVTLYANMPWVFPDETELNRQSLYVMSEYSYRNKFYLEYAKEVYSPDLYSFDYARSNIKDGYLLDDSILIKSLAPSQSNIWCVLITIGIIGMFIFSIAFIFRLGLFRQPISILVITATSFLPYLIFKVIFNLSLNTFIFSSYSLMLTLILMIVYFLLILLLNFFGREVVTEV